MFPLHPFVNVFLKVLHGKLIWSMKSHRAKFGDRIQSFKCEPDRFSCKSQHSPNRGDTTDVPIAVICISVVRGSWSLGNNGAKSHQYQLRGTVWLGYPLLPLGSAWWTLELFQPLEQRRPIEIRC